MACSRYFVSVEVLARHVAGKVHKRRYVVWRRVLVGEGGARVGEGEAGRVGEGEAGGRRG